MDFIRQDLPPAFKEFLTNHGDVPIVSMVIAKMPIQKVFDTILNIITFGGWAAAKSKYNYDDLFHLFLVVVLADQTVVRIEKNQVLSITSIPHFNPEQIKFMEIESYADGLKNGTFKHLTISDLMTNIIDKYGKKQVVLYSANKYNCQHFISGLLISSNVINPSRRYEILDSVNGFIPTAETGTIGYTNQDDIIYNFINQNASKLFNELSPMVGASIQTLTDAASVFDKILYGGKRPILQSILFDKDHWRQQDAQDWLETHNIVPIKPPHIVGNHIRFRISDPVPNVRYFTKTIMVGVNEVFMY